MSTPISTYLIFFAAGLVILMLLSTVHRQKETNKKLKSVWHGHVVWQEEEPIESAVRFKKNNLYTVHGPQSRPNPINFDEDIKAIEDARNLTSKRDLSKDPKLIVSN